MLVCHDRCSLLFAKIQLSVVGRLPGAAPCAQGRLMADVVECINKLTAAGKITAKVAEEALEFYKRSKAEYSREMGAAIATSSRTRRPAAKAKCRQNEWSFRFSFF
jgi:hypothetical protein